MIRLNRTVRFCINPATARSAPTPKPAASTPPRRNTFAAWPSMRGLGAYYELEIGCVGEPDPQTGYMVNITRIDRAVRDRLIPLIEIEARERPGTEPASMLPWLMKAAQSELGDMVDSVSWQLTPYHSVGMSSTSQDVVAISQQFEFSASHRLHSPELSDEENRAIFGRCNNPNSHGHNYRLKVTAAVRFNPAAGELLFRLCDMERIVDDMVISRFDHKHLNLDTREFASLNPSVEHIAKVCFDLLAGPIVNEGAKLTSVTVWETEKTSATYPAGPG